MTEGESIAILRGIEAAESFLTYGYRLDLALNEASRDTGAPASAIALYWLEKVLAVNQARDLLALEPKPNGRPRGPSRALPELELDE